MGGAGASPPGLIVPVAELAANLDADLASYLLLLLNSVLAEVADPDLGDADTVRLTARVDLAVREVKLTVDGYGRPAVRRGMS